MSATLNEAIKLRDLLLVKTIVAQSENFTKLVDPMHPPLHDAYISTDPDIIQYILEQYQKNNISINIKDEYGWTARNFSIYNLAR
jgi:hypothetical protein